MIFLIIAVLTTVLVGAQEETPNSLQARRMMDTAYERVFGEEGSTLTYHVNIIGIYKTHGTIFFKGKKQRFIDERVDTWNDGVTAYMAYRKKHTVEIHNANSDKKDKHSGKFKFSLDDFSYYVESNPKGYLVTMKQKKGAKGTVKEAKVLLAPVTYAPIKLRIKVAFFWTTIKISDFKSGGINDDMFVFPAEKYAGWKMVDKR